MKFLFSNGAAARYSRSWLLTLIALISFSAFQTFAEDAPPAPATTVQDPEEIMGAEGMEGLFGRLGLKADDFGPSGGAPQGKEPPKGGTPNPAKKQDEFAETREEKLAREEEERAAAGSGDGGAGDGAKGTEKLEALKLNEAQRKAVDDLIAAGSGELDPEKLGLSKEQTEGLNDIFTEMAAAEEPKQFDLEALGLDAEKKQAIAAALAEAAKGAPDAAKLQTDLEATKAANLRLTQELTQAKQQPWNVANLPPVLLLNDPAKIGQWEKQMEDFEQWATENWEGTEAKEAVGDRPAVPAFSGEEIRKRYHEVKRQREKLAPLARRQLAEQQKADEVAKGVYPDLFKADSADAQMMNGIMAALPGIHSVLPNIRMIIGDALVGERIRTEKSKRSDKVKLSIKGISVKLAPKLPTSAKPARPAAANTRKDDGISENKFLKFKAKGLSEKDALAAMVMDSALVNN